MTSDEAGREMRALGWWFQHFDLPNGLNTGDGQPGGYDAMTRWRHIEPYVPERLDGRTVLDLGGNAGFFAIQMKLRGAARCVVVDPFVEFNRQARFAARQFDVEIEVINDDAHTYCLTTEAHFDYVVFLGLFYHLKYPGLVLDRVAEMTRHRLYVQSHTVGRPHPAFEARADYRLRIDDAEIEQPAFPKMAFLEGRYNGDDTNWWLPNDTALAAMTRSAGMAIVARPHPQVIVAEPRRRLGTRVYSKLVFPVYAKEGGAAYPGAQSFIGGGAGDAPPPSGRVLQALAASLTRTPVDAAACARVLGDCRPSQIVAVGHATPPEMADGPRWTAYAGLRDLPVEAAAMLSAGDVFSLDLHGDPDGGDAIGRLVFALLPHVRPGVAVHVHGIDSTGTVSGRGSGTDSAAAVLRAFLQFNDAFEVWPFAPAGDGAVPPGGAERDGASGPLLGPRGSIWLRRVR